MPEDQLRVNRNPTPLAYGTSVRCSVAPLMIDFSRDGAFFHITTEGVGTTFFERLNELNLHKNRGINGKALTQFSNLSDIEHPFPVKNLRNNSL